MSATRRPAARPEGGTSDAAPPQSACRAQTTLIVAVPRDAEGELLVRELQRSRARVTQVWPLVGQLPATADVILCEAAMATPEYVPWLPGEAKCPLIAIADEGTSLATLNDCAPDAILHRPFTPATIASAMLLARTHFDYARRLQTRISRLEEIVRSIRNVERAKSILMSTRQIPEDEAYRLMRSQAMTRRIPIGVLASVIVDNNAALSPCEMMSKHVASSDSN
jgi:AmiR/NasT family two-component response regulator